MRIIIADDIYANRLLISEIVRGLGHELIEVENGQQVLDAIDGNRRIDLVLMDIEMPVMNGMEATRRIRERPDYPKNSIPVVAITGHNPCMFFNDFKSMGFDQLLTKPYSIDKITGLLESFDRR